MTSKDKLNMNTIIRIKE